MPTMNIFDMTDTWNASGTTFTSIKMNTTDTASAVGSLLMDLQVGGVSRFSVNKLGHVIAGGATGVYDALFKGTQPASTVGILLQQSVGAYSFFDFFDPNNQAVFRLDEFGVLAFGRPFIASVETFIRSDAPNTLAQRNGVNAQAFRLYNTFTDASNFERGFMKWTSNALHIGTEKLGTGQARDLIFQTDGVTRLTIGAAGLFLTGGTISSGGDIIVQNAISFGNGGFKGSLYSQSEGVWTMWNANSTDFNRLQWGGTTSAFPSLKRSGTTLQVRLADDSGFASISGLVDLTATNAANSIGTRGVPQNSRSASYTLVAADAGQHILHPATDTTARTFTIPANSAVAFPIGTVVTFINQNAAGVVTIAITTNIMRLAGAGTTGSRTLAANGIATCTKITSTEWIISGVGLT